MLNPKKMFTLLKKNKIDFFTGVPDSVLKNFTSLIPQKKNFVVANEGSGVALASGYYLKKKKIPLVYMQNSGLGNAVNPLVSLTHKNVFSIPMILLIGWRGMPGKPDEPQHQIMGKITRKILNLINIKNIILKKESDLKNLKKLISFSKKNKVPVACLVPPNILISAMVKKKFNIHDKFKIKRYEVISSLLDIIGHKKEYNLISTTGYTSRELNELIAQKNNVHCKSFFAPGSMGHVGNISLGSSIDKRNKIICLDGDGSILMHFGSLNDISNFSGSNFKHILMNNNSHESVGGQTTKSSKINFKNIVIGLGYKSYHQINRKKDLSKKIKKFIKVQGPSFLEIKISDGTLKNLSRPKNFIEIKKRFMSK